MQLSTIRIAWRNLGRNRRRTALAMMAIAVGQFALLATNGILHGYVDNIRNAITGPLIGHVQIHHADWREERAMDLALRDYETVMDTVRETDSVEDAGARIYAPVLVAPERDAYTGVVVGVDIGFESRTYGMLTGWDRELGEKDVLLGYRLANRMQVEVGAEVAIVGQGADGSIANELYTVREVIRSPVDLVNQSGIIMHLAEAQWLFMMDGQAHEIVVRATDSEIAGELSETLRQKPALAGLEVLPWKELVPELVLILEMSKYAGYLVLILVFIAAVAGVANTLMMATFERIREFGMLLALGSHPRRIVGMIIVEALLLGVLGVAVGTALGYGFVGVAAQTGIDMASWGGQEARDLSYQGLNLPLDIYPRLELLDSVVGLITVMFTALVAALWPASLAARLEPMEAMRA